MNGRSLGALAVAVALAAFTATPAEAACPPYQTDAWGRAVPVLMSVRVEDSFVYRTAFAEGRLLPEPIMTAVANRHPCGQITSAECGRCFWTIKLCDRGQPFEMNVDHGGSVLKDDLR